MTLVPHHGVLGSLGEFTLWLKVSLFQLGLQLSDLLHVSFRNILKADFVIALDNQLFTRCLKVSLKILHIRI